MSKFLKEFKDFALKGNMIDMAVGIIMAFVVFCVVKQLNRLRRKPEESAPAAPTEKECPFCRTSIAIMPPAALTVLPCWGNRRVRQKRRCRLPSPPAPAV